MTLQCSVATKGLSGTWEQTGRKKKSFCLRSVRPDAFSEENLYFSVSGRKATSKEESEFETFYFSWGKIPERARTTNKEKFISNQRYSFFLFRSQPVTTGMVLSDVSDVFEDFFYAVRFPEWPSGLGCAEWALTVTSANLTRLR